MGAACGQMRLYYLYLLVMSHTWRGAGGKGWIFISIYVVFVLENLVIIAALCRVTWPGNYTIIEPSAACHNQHAQGHEHNQQQCRDPWLHFAIRFQPNWSEVIQLEGEVLQFCWKRNNLHSLKNVRLAGCVEVEQTSPRI